jgi:predicted N-formylglutamate amidohydrolase
MAATDPFELLNPNGKANLLLLSDHASNAMPPRYKHLGLDASAMETHIAYDIGAAGVTRQLAKLMEAPALLSRWSRLLIDLNRDPGDPTSIPEQSDGTPIPGNRNLPAAERQARIVRYFTPYHRAVDERLQAFRKRTLVPCVVSIHSFTPQLNGGDKRPWHAGVLWDKDPRLALPLLNTLRPQRDIEVGDNEPYSARAPKGYTMEQHAVKHGLPHAVVEIRQDLIGDEKGQKSWAERLSRALKPLVAKQYKMEKFS